MNSRPAICLLVTSDPRSSTRAAEAVRVAAGLAGWQKLRVTLCLLGPAALGLDETQDDLLDAELFRQHLPGLVAGGGRVVVRKDDPFLVGLTHALVSWVEVDAEQLADLLTGPSTILRF